MSALLRKFLLMLILALSTALASERYSAQLDTVNALREQADASNALQLAPQSYNLGIQSLERARRDIEAGRAAERIRDRLTEAGSHFEEALATATTARNVLGEALARRSAAQEAQAFRFAGERWLAAERLLEDAARRLERGDTSTARSRGADAANTYAEAELEAIRLRYLAGVRSQIAEAHRLRAGRYAPRTLARARELLDQADQALAENRHQPDAAAGQIQDAADEAAHAIALARIGEEVRRGNLSLEDVILELESGIATMAAAAGLSADFTRPHAQSTGDLARELGQQREEMEDLRRELADQTRLALNLEEEIRELQARLGDTGAQRDELMMMLQAQARIREQFDQAEGLFEADEARVLREGDQLIIRLTGLTFRSGSDRLPENSSALINKVVRAIRIFPRSRVLIEGHTDSTGSDSINQRLSETRAQAVADALTEELRLGPGQIGVIGHGPSRPIANNATEAGRAQNRRIDVIITPNLEQPGF